MKVAWRHAIGAAAIACADLLLEFSFSADVEHSIMSEELNRQSPLTASPSPSEDSLPEAQDSDQPADNEQEEEESVESESYDVDLVSGRMRPSLGSTLAWAKERLSPEEYAAANEEAWLELNRFQKTTTTTPAPGLLKETASGAWNFFTAPFRATAAVMFRPRETFRMNKGSVAIASQKVESAVSGKEGAWKDLARELWRLLTMNPEREREAQRENARAALEDKSVARNIMKSDGAVAEVFGEKLREIAEADNYTRQLQQEGKMEEELQREFERLLEKGR